MRICNAMTRLNFCSPLRPSFRIKPHFMSACRWGILDSLLRQATLSYIVESCSATCFAHLIEGLLYFEDYSRLSLNGHFYKTDNSPRRTPGVGSCCFSVILLINYTCYKSTISPKQTTNPFETVNGNLCFV